MGNFVARLGPVPLILAGVVGAGLVIACSAILDANVVQCSIDADCVSRGFAAATCVNKVCVRNAVDAAIDAPVDAADAAPVDPKWGCLGNVKWGIQDVVAPKVTLHQRFVHLIGEGPVAQMNVQACGRLDPSCTTPLGTGITNDAGAVTLTVPRYFEGFLSLDPPATFPNMVPSFISILPPPGIDDDPDASSPPAHLNSQNELNALLKEVGTSFHPDLANLLAIVLDCQGQVTSGVTLTLSSIDSATVSYYTDDTGTPSVTSKETGSGGGAGFVNAPTGPLTVTADVIGIGKRFGTYTFFMKAGHNTFVAIPPGPSN